jgi:hypothetical protein
VNQDEQPGQEAKCHTQTGQAAAAHDWDRDWE